jgi:hypothetical protein
VRVLIACERSGILREAFNALAGVHAYSCDLEPCEDGRVDYHLQCDVFDVLDQSWDLVIAHPPCTFVCNSSALRLYRGGKKANGPDPERWRKMADGARFIRRIWHAPIKRMAIENPIMLRYARLIIKGVGEGPHVPYLYWPEPQIVQPHWFGDDASKATCLWTRNLPPLVPTRPVPPRYVNGRPRWANQTDSGQNRLGPSPTRGIDRARTYPGFAAAIAAQWGVIRP